MTMTKAQKVRLGTFVLTGLVLFFGTIAFVLGLRMFEERDVYAVFYHGNVAGLELGSAVRYQGLRVGTVSGMEVSEEDPSAIEIELALEPDTELHEGTEAILELSGITGLKTVNLVPGDPRNPVIEPGSRIPPGSSFVQRISGDAEAIAEKVERLAENLTNFVSPTNLRRIEDLLDNMNRVLENADAVLTELRPPAKSALEQATATGASLERTSDELRGSLRRIRPEVVAALQSARGALDEAKTVLAAVDPDEVRDTIAKTNEIVGRFEHQLSEVELGDALQDMETALVRLTDLLDEVDLVVRASRQDFIASLKAVRETTEELREFSRLISQDPSLLLRGTENRQ
jgi:phospholipid/cholesterol/gamma-HCH transport system substrate-binding protein